MIMNDKSVQQAVVDELEWDPSVDSAHIGVTARNGVVTLTGYVNSYTEKWSAHGQRGACSVSKPSQRNSKTPPKPMSVNFAA